MRVLIWQWGRSGSGPRLATLLAEGMRSVSGTKVVLSLSTGAEILRSATPPECDLPVKTYSSLSGFILRAAGSVFAVRGMARRIRRLRPDVAICVMPGPLDLLMARALNYLRVPFIVLVHEVDCHPGDGMPFQMALQRALCRYAAAIGALSTHVGDQLRLEGLADTPNRPLIRLRHPPVGFALPPPRPWPHQGMRLLLFGRLRQYKGLDLLAEALTLLGPQPGLEVRIVGSGPESLATAALRLLPGVVVENRWVPEDAVGAVLAWSDALVLPYRESSQSGVAAAALASGRRILATNVGGLAEQLNGERLALLCQPTKSSLASGLRRLMEEGPVITAPPRQAADAAWQELAATLCTEIEALVL
jgi:glycosyltransferase involved in cell wall biosynthesis